VGLRARCVAAILALALLPTLGLGQEAATPAVQVSVDTHRVMFPTPTDQMLDQGQVALDPGRGAYALRVEVSPPEDSRAWVLYLRASTATFRSEGQGKPCHDLWWKFDHEGVGAYRPVEDKDSIVLEGRNEGRVEAVVDLLLDLDWSTPPGVYGLGLVFTLVAE